jgi:RNA polymerase-binding protein DksA
MNTQVTMEQERKNNSKLTPDEIQRFKAMLLSEWNEILRSIISIEDETLRKQISDLSRLPIHMADIGTDNYGQEFALGLMDSERKLLAEIDAALQRIEDGTYGICEGSGQPIPKARLEAIPWARYCIEYANLLEKGLVKKKGFFNNSKYYYKTDDEQDDSIYLAEE